MNTVNFYQIIQLFDHICSLRGSTGMLHSLWAEIACINNQYANRAPSNMSKNIFQVKIRVQSPPQRGSAPASGVVKPSRSIGFRCRVSGFRLVLAFSLLTPDTRHLKPKGLRRRFQPVGLKGRAPARRAYSRDIYISPEK